MSKASEPVTIRVLDREYTVGVEPDERDSLVAAAKLLDNKMREIRGDTDRRERELAKTVGAMQRRLDDLFDTPPA